jgi:hydroxymethylbilane synthase
LEGIADWKEEVFEAMRRFIIGTRGSQMALCQANQVAHMLRSHYQQDEFVVAVIRSQGDTFQGNLRDIGGKGAFVRSLDEALLQETVHVAVNCLKDIPNDLERTSGITIAGVLPRSDIREVLIARSGLSLRELAVGTRVGTSSPRRAALLRRMFPDLLAVPMRGSADTRVKKLDAGEVDALLLAKAGVERINLTNRITEIIPTEMLCPALGAGIVTMDVRAIDSEMKRLIGNISHLPTFQMMKAERGFLNGLRGNCFTACAGYSFLRDEQTISLNAQILSEDGSICIKGTRSGNVEIADSIGQELAQELLDRGGRSLIISNRY